MVLVFMLFYRELSKWLKNHKKEEENHNHIGMFLNIENSITSLYTFIIIGLGFLYKKLSLFIANNENF